MTRLPSFILIFLISLALLSTGCGNKKKILTSHTTTKNITIDGNLSDWPHDKAMIHSTEYFDFYVTNDERYLYFYTTFKSRFYQNAVTNVGFTIYVDNNENIKQSFGITYPLGVTNAMRDMPRVRDEYTDDPEWMKEKANQKLWERLQKTVFDRVMLTRKLSPKADPQHLILPLEQVNAQGIKIARNQESRQLQLEMRLPIQSSRVEQFAADPMPGKPLRIGFVIQPPEFDLSDDVGNSMTSTRSRGGYYGRGYGSRGRRPNSNDLERRMSQRMGEYAQWFWIQL